MRSIAKCRVLNASDFYLVVVAIRINSGPIFQFNKSRKTSCILSVIAVLVRTSSSLSLSFFNENYSQVRRTVIGGCLSPTDAEEGKNSVQEKWTETPPDWDSERRGISSIRPYCQFYRANNRKSHHYKTV